MMNQTKRTVILDDVFPVMSESEIQQARAKFEQAVQAGRAVVVNITSEKSSSDV